MRLMKAEPTDAEAIFGVLQEGRRFLKEQGVDQWQATGAPSREETEASIARGEQYVVRTDEGEIAGVCTIVAHEPDYDVIEGRWKQDGGYLAVHRVATSAAFRRRGVTAVVYGGAEALARECGAKSVRADTHKDNAPMRGVFLKNGFEECGVVRINGGTEERVAYEKVLI